MSSNKGLVKLWYIHTMGYSGTVIYKTNDTERYPFMVYYCTIRSMFIRKNVYVCMHLHAHMFLGFLQKQTWKNVSGRNLWMVEFWLILNLCVFFFFVFSKMSGIIYVIRKKIFVSLFLSRYMYASVLKPISYSVADTTVGSGTR